MKRSEGAMSSTRERSIPRQHDDVYFMALADQFAGDMRPDEPDPSCEQHFHKREPYWAV